jgi:drug/metabolite transporter (DMT)-like permease
VHHASRHPVRGREASTRHAPHHGHRAIGRRFSSSGVQLNTRGFLLAILAGIVFQFLNATVKHLSHELPPLQVAWLRWLAGVLCIAPFAWHAGKLGTRELRLHAFRACFHGGGYTLWYLGVALIPLATTAALSFTGPLFVTLGAALFLGEKVRPRRWAAVVVGFAGVLVILRPGLVPLEGGVLFMLASVPLIAGSNLVAKVIAGRDTPVQVVFWQSLLAALIFTPFGLLLWQPVSAAQLGLALLAGLFGTVAYFLYTWSLRLVDISAIQPLAFLSILWASLLDLLVFGGTADLWTFFGAAIVVVAAAAVISSPGEIARKKT